MAEQELLLKIKQIQEGGNVLTGLNKEIRETTDRLNKLYLTQQKGTPEWNKEANSLKGLTNVKSKLRGEINQLVPSTNKLTSSIGGIASTVGNLTKVFAALGIGLIVKKIGAEILSFGKETIDSFNKQEIAVSKLKNGLKNLGDESGFSKLEKQAQNLQKISIFGDEQIMNAQAMLTTFKLNSDQIEILTPRLLDMASAFEKTGQGEADLQQLSVLLGKAVGSELTGALSRWGVIMTDTEKKQLENARGMEKTILLSQILDKNFKGMSETVGNTFAGKMKQLSNAWDDIKETIGASIVDALTPFVKIIQDLMPTFSEIINSIMNFVKEMGGFYSSVIGGTDGIKSFLTSLISLVKEGLEYLMSTYREKIAPALKDFYQKIVDLIKENPELLSGLKAIGKILLDLGSSYISKVVKGFGYLVDAFDGVVKASRWIKEAIKDVIDWIDTLFSSITKTIDELPFVKSIKEAIGSVMQVINDFADWAANNPVMSILFPGIVFTKKTSERDWGEGSDFPPEYDPNQVTPKQNNKDNQNNDEDKKHDKQKKQKEEELNFTKLAREEESKLLKQLDANFESAQAQKEIWAKILEIRAKIYEYTKDEADLQKYLEAELKSNIKAKPLTSESIKDPTEELYKRFQTEGGGVNKKVAEFVNPHEEIAKRIKEVYTNLANSLVGIMGNLFASFVPPQNTLTPMQQLLKNLLVTLITFVQGYIIASSALLAAKGITTFGISLITDAPLIAAAFAALEIAKGFIGAFASGTDFLPRSGYALVGEQGPELLNLSRGSQIFSNANTQKILSNNTKAGDIYIMANMDALEFQKISQPQYRTYKNAKRI